MKKFWMLVVLLVLAIPSIGCQTHTYAGRGATLGGLTGGGLGALIGEASADNPLAGAAVGSAVGAMAGASIGGALDEIDAKTQPAVYHEGLAEPTSVGEVVAMTQAGLSDSIITRHICSHGFPYKLSANDLILLRERGVTDAVIATLQDAPEPAVLHAPMPVPRPVVVEEHYLGHPAWYGPPRPRYRRVHLGPRHKDVHWGIHVGY